MPTRAATIRGRMKGPLLPAVFVPFTMRTTVREDHLGSIPHRFGAHHCQPPRMGTVGRRQIHKHHGSPAGRDTSKHSHPSNASLERYLQDRFVAYNDIHMDLPVCIEH
jgi:hypothetical protein